MGLLRVTPHFVVRGHLLALIFFLVIGYCLHIEYFRYVQEFSSPPRNYLEKPFIIIIMMGTTTVYLLRKASQHLGFSFYDPFAISHFS